LADVKLLRKGRSYGHAYAMAVLGLEQLGMAIFWLWTVLGLIKRLPKDFRKSLLKSTKRERNIYRDHKKKQTVTIFNFIQVVFIFIIQSEMENAPQEPMTQVGKRMIKKYIGFLRKMAKVFQDLDKKKMKGLYIDGFGKKNTGPHQFKAKDIDPIMGVLEMLIDLFRKDFKDIPGPKTAALEIDAFRLWVMEIEEFSKGKENLTAEEYTAQLNEVALKIWEESVERLKKGALIEDIIRERTKMTEIPDWFFND
jgi:AbiV family abortive infection protein